MVLCPLLKGDSWSIVIPLSKKVHGHKINLQYTSLLFTRSLFTIVSKYILLHITTENCANNSI